jgi:hypothetical protein
MRIEIPGPVARQLDAASASWAQHCMDNPLVDPRSGVRVHLLGTAHFAPRQHTQLNQLMRRLAPAAVAIEQPLLVHAPPEAPGGRSVLLPYPPFIDALLAHWDELQLDESPQGGTPENNRDTTDLRLDLQGCKTSARVGRDVLDPYECFG